MSLFNVVKRTVGVVPRHCRQNVKSKNLSTFGTVPLQEDLFIEKSAVEAWSWDKGAYPVMSLIAIGLIGGGAFGVHKLLQSPDIKLVPGKSRSKMFRGELADEYLKEDVDPCKPW